MPPFVAEFAGHVEQGQAFVAGVDMRVHPQRRPVGGVVDQRDQQVVGGVRGGRGAGIEGLVQGVVQIPAEHREGVVVAADVRHLRAGPRSQYSSMSFITLRARSAASGISKRFRVGPKRSLEVPQQVLDVQRKSAQPRVSRVAEPIEPAELVGDDRTVGQIGVVDGQTLEPVGE